ncbi:MAG: HAD family phosphatase [Burkholderiaceae bacterium]
MDDTPSSLPGRAALRAVIFDMDGLMLDTERVSLQAWTLASEELGARMPESLAYGIIGMNRAGSHAFLRQHLGEDFPLAELAERTHAHYLRILDTEGIRLKAGLDGLLAWLGEAGIPCAVATSTRHHLAIDKLDRAGIVGHFTHIVGGDQVAHGKPAPDIYLEAARRLEVPAGQCIALEDSINGVRSAHAAGVPVILVPDLVQPPPEVVALACAALPSLAQARAVIESRL